MFECPQGLGLQLFCVVCCHLDPLRKTIEKGYENEDNVKRNERLLHCTGMNKHTMLSFLNHLQWLQTQTDGQTLSYTRNYTTTRYMCRVIVNYDLKLAKVINYTQQ